MKKVFIFNIVLVLLSICLAIYFFSEIFFYIIISLSIATILRIPTNYLNRVVIFGGHLPRFFNPILAFSSIGLVIWALVGLISPLIKDETAFISHINISDLIHLLQKPIGYIENFLIKYLTVGKDPGFLQDYILTTFKNFYEILNISIVNSILSFTGSVLTGILTVTFITFFLLYEQSLFHNALMYFVPNYYFEIVINVLIELEILLSNYLLGLFVQMFCIFSICWMGFLILGSEYALLIAIFAALANLIPFLGPTIGSITGILIEFSTNQNLQAYPDYTLLLFKILIIFGIIQLADNILFQPIIFSKSIQAHPVQIFLIVITGAVVGGILGMLLAIPFLVIVKVLYKTLFKNYKNYGHFKYSKDEHINT